MWAALSRLLVRLGAVRAHSYLCALFVQTVRLPIHARTLPARVFLTVREPHRTLRLRGARGFVVTCSAYNTQQGFSEVLQFTKRADVIPTKCSIAILKPVLNEKLYKGFTSLLLREVTSLMAHKP